jgi:hypothetical protein
MSTAMITSTLTQRREGRGGPANSDFQHLLTWLRVFVDFFRPSRLISGWIHNSVLPNPHQFVIIPSTYWLRQIMPQTTARIRSLITHGGLNPRPTYAFGNWCFTLYKPLYVTEPGTVRTEEVVSTEKLLPLYQTTRCHFAAVITQTLELYLRFPCHCLGKVRFSWMLLRVARRQAWRFGGTYCLPCSGPQNVSKNTRGARMLPYTTWTWKSSASRNVALTPNYICKKLCGFSPLANYTDRAIAVGQWKLVPTFSG